MTVQSRAFPTITNELPRKLYQKEKLAHNCKRNFKFSDFSKLELVNLKIRDFSSMKFVFTVFQIFHECRNNDGFLWVIQ